MKIEMISNPRKPDGGFGDICCDLCGSYSGAYAALNTAVFHRPHEVHRTVVCKGCLLGWVDLVNETILQNAVERGRLREDQDI